MCFRLSDAVRTIQLYTLIHPDCKFKTIEINPDDKLKFIQVCIAHDYLITAQVPNAYNFQNLSFICASIFYVHFRLSLKMKWKIPKYLIYFWKI